MTHANEITVCRHAAQKMLHWALSSAPRPCLGLLAGHGCHIDDAVLLERGPGDPETARAAAALREHGLSIIGWFHVRSDSHEPDDAAMAALEGMDMPEPRPPVPLHLLVAMDMKGRLDLQAYIRNHGDRPERTPLRLVDDTLYLGTFRR